MVMVMRSGMTVQVTSRTIEPWRGRGTSSGWRRRYLTAKTIRSSVMSVEKKMVMSSR
jgi:hypothetical protein